MSDTPPFTELCERDVAKALAQHFGPHEFDDLPLDKAEIRLLARQGHIYAFTQADLLDAAKDALAAMSATQSAELAALRERLEIDTEAPGYDGIAARDETIRQLERQLAALRAKGERMAEALDGVIAVADRKTDEFDRAKQALADWRGEG